MSHPAPARDVAYVDGKLVLPDGKRVSFVTTEELAAILFKPVLEIEKWRIKGKYPELRFLRCGRLIRYSADSVIRHIEQHTFATTKEAGSKMSARSNRLRSQKMKARLADKRLAEASRVQS